MMRRITIDGMGFDVPGEWDELSRQQLEFLSRLLDEQRSAVEVRTMMLLHGLGAEVHSSDPDGYDLTLQGRRMVIDAERISWMADLYGFLFEDDGRGGLVLAPQLTISPYPEITRRGVRLTSSSDGMLSMPFGRYVWMQTYLSRAGHDSDYLDLSLACEWHSLGDLLEPKESDARIIRSLPVARRMVMFWYVSGCLRRIYRLFPRVFSGGGPPMGGNVLDQQLRLLDSLAGGDMTKKDQVRRGKLIDALYVIDESIRRKEEHEREVDRLNNRRK